MQRRTATAFVVAAVLVAFPAIAAGGSIPLTTVSCSATGMTRVDWQHAKVTKVTIAWHAPAGSPVTFDPLVLPNLTPNPPRGFVSAGTPSAGGVVPESATVSLEQKSGDVVTVTTSCN